MKHALIIAGSRGLGFGLVREYLARGWHVTATARTPSDELVALHRDAAGRLVVELLDVTVVAQAAALEHFHAGWNHRGFRNGADM